MLQIWRSPVTSPASQWCCTYNRLSGATRQPLRQTGGDSRAMMGTPGASQHAHSQAFNAVAAQVYADEQFGKLTSQIQNHLALLGKPVQCKVRNWLKKLREEASYVAATPPPPPRCRRRCLPACLPPPGMDPPNFNFLAPCACRPPMWCGNVTATLMPGCCWSSCGAARWPSRSRRCRPTARCPAAGSSCISCSTCRETDGNAADVRQHQPWAAVPTPGRLYIHKHVVCTHDCTHPTPKNLPRPTWRMTGSVKRI